MNTKFRTTGLAGLGIAVVMLAALWVPMVSAQAGTYGSQIKVGDSDFVPVSGALGLAPTFIHIDFGVVGDVNDDCTYVETSAVGARAPVNYDVRVTPCQGKAAGTLVSDGDTTEKGAVAGAGGWTAPAMTLHFADVNNNGRYDSGDCVFATTAGAAPGAGLAASTGFAAFTVRLTGCSGKAAGTYVFASDSDFTSYGAAGATGAFGAAPSVFWFDADKSAAGAFTPGDSLYLANTAVLLPAGSLFPLTSVRLGGPAVVSGGGGGGGGGVTTTPPTGGSGNMTTPPTGPTTTPTGPTTTPVGTTNPTATTTTSSKTPSLGMAGAVVGVAAALSMVALRRKR